MSFLKAEWRRLVIINYKINPDILLPYLPYKTELDTWQENHYISLVGFMFNNTKVIGLSIPFHINFEEVNLRFYVRYYDSGTWKRGVVFIKELVPKRAITFIANSIYKEHYETIRMNHIWDKYEDKLITGYGVRKDKTWNAFSVTTNPKSEPIAQGSETEFITEHYCGYSKYSEHKTFEYEVTHPRWEVYPIVDYRIKWNHASIFGDQFESLNSRSPFSIMLAEGSKITVENKRAIV